MRLHYLFHVLVSFCAQTVFSIEIVNIERVEYHFPKLVRIIEGLKGRAPDLLESSLDLETAIANTKIAASERGMQFGVNISGQSIYEDRPNQDYNQRYRAFSSVYFRKAIFNWGELQAQEDISQINKDQARSELISLERSVIGQVRSLFLNLVVLSFREKLAREGSKLADQNLKDLKQREKVGFNSTIEVEEAEAVFLNRKIDLEEIKFLLSKEESLLRSISGYREVLSFSPQSNFIKFCLEHKFPQHFPVFLASGTSSAMDNISGLIEKEKKRIIIAESKLKPKFNLAGTFYQDQIDSLSSKNNVDRNNFVFGLEANWPLWDSGKSKAEKSAAIARKRNLESKLERASRAQKNLVEELRQELESLKERILLSRKLLNVANNRFEKANILFQQNRLSSTDLFSAQLALDQAKLGNISAVCRYLQTLDQYEQSFGVFSQSSNNE